MTRIKAAWMLTFAVCFAHDPGLPAYPDPLPLQPAVVATNVEAAGTTTEAEKTGEAPSLLAQDESSAALIPRDQLSRHLPDIEEVWEQAQESLKKARKEGESADMAYYTNVLKRISTIRRTKQIRLSLEDVIGRTLANNYTIQTLSYNPAIDSTRVVEAEAAFDAVFFGNTTRNKVDQPTANQLFSTGLEQFDLDLGIRKPTPLGALVTGRYTLNQVKQNFAFQTLNPAYTSSFILSLRQPLLRGFGLDFNRSTILITKNNRRISDLAFHRQVRDTLRQVEELYWRLVQARRDAVTVAREVADFEGIYQYLLARKDFDILPVNIFASEADLETTRADFVRRRDAVFDAEDRLVSVMNDPNINLADDVELIPTDFPQLERIVVDRLAEVQTALDHRTEIQEQQLQVANAKISVGQAKNSELPQVDLAFTMTVRGLGPSADQSFDGVTRNDFISYNIAVQFEVPIGNRSARAARRRAQLQHAQAIAQLRRTLEDVILDANLAVRQLDTTYNQIPPSFASVQARQRELDSRIARAERKDYATLTSELAAWRQLASVRRTILNSIVEYNIAIADLERAKGTLLLYNNVIIPSEQQEDQHP